MEIRPIRSKKDYQAAVEEIDRLMDFDEDPEAASRLEVLAVLATAWQREHRPIGSAKPADAIRAAIDDRGITRQQLARLIGESKVSEILAGKRGLSLSMVATLHRELQIPLRSLIDLDARPRPRGRGSKRIRTQVAARAHGNKPRSRTKRRD